MGWQPPPRALVATRYLPGIYGLKIRPLVWSTETGRKPTALWDRDLETTVLLQCLKLGTEQEKGADYRVFKWMNLKQYIDESYICPAFLSVCLKLPY